MARQTPKYGITIPESSDHTRLFDHFDTHLTQIDGSLDKVAGIRGYWNGATNAAGLVTVNHPLGVVPTSVQITVYAPLGTPAHATCATVQVNAISATAVELRFIRHDGPTLAVLSGNPIQFWYRFDV